MIHVLADGSGDVSTIAAAYQIAQSGDDIQLGPGVYFEHDIAMKCLYVVGAFLQGCGTISIESESWGSVKARYR